MKYFVCIILLAIGVKGQRNGESVITASNAGKNVEKAITDDDLDQNTASGNVNTNKKEFEGNFGRIGENNYYGDNYDGRFSGRNIKEMLFDEKYNNAEELFRTREYDKFRFDEGNPVSIFGEKLGSSNDFHSASKDTDYLNVYKEGIDYSDRNRDQSRNVGDILDYTSNIAGVFGKKEYEYQFGFDAGNPDIHGEIIRPCQAYDTFCIRKFLTERSHCKASGRRLPDPCYRAQNTFNYPSANISVTCDGLEYTGLNSGRVEEFYINKKTDNLVIAISFGLISVSTKNANAVYHLRGREPIVTQDFGAIFYVQTTVTFVIPGLDDLRLDRAEIYTYSDSPLPPFIIGPRIGLSTDPEVLAMFAYLSSVNVPLELREELSTEGVFYGTNFLQYNICDFGLKVL